MGKLKIDTRFVVLLLFILITGAWRFFISSSGEVSILSNFSPLGAMALFGGVYFKSWKGYAFPLLTIWISDIFMNRFIFFGEWKFFYDGFIWVYGAFALMVLVGKWLHPNKSVLRFIGSSLLIVFIHWIVTDIGVWIGSTIYPQTLAGFWACLVAAIPYEIRFLGGSLIYGVVLFGSFEWASYKFRSLQPKTITQ
ncbi:MAG: hypothetical protein ED557_15655 [Balneola sp.]|nr:MAG: hypothetical protein ED557_15655 [Balneola sp.]